ncbi:MAG: HNH endonuclease [Defluviitaleaceae bacterium]|nr:HNH endonuclease [Defluviitaleaceae bacterium]
MICFDEFLDNVLPGNYFLTKSMELTKARESGTLWYTKKFLVFYYYIFLTEKIETTEYRREIVEIFDNYVASLPVDVREEAEDFFYPCGERGISNLRQEGFRYFSDFRGNARFESAHEKRVFYEMAKKYYFSFLMGSGGQRGVKAEIKSNLYKPDFDMTKLDDIDNVAGVKNDYHAFLRNERQVLYYWGFFHSRSSGAKDREFSSLTPVGELALRANFDEFLAIWEHQKIKMLSQPPTVKTDKILVDAPERFAISFGPYHDILSWMRDNSEIKKDEYQYILSRKNNRFSEEQWQTIMRDARKKNNYDKLKEYVESFCRESDIRTEDFHKEMAKYLLGLRDDLKKDKGTNYLGICKDIGKYQVTKPLLLQNILKIYSALEKYKLQKYETLYTKCEQEIRRQYIARACGESYNIDRKIKIDWDMYNITPDRLVVFAVIVAQVCAIHDIEPTRESVFDCIDTMLSRFSMLLSRVGLVSKTKISQELKLFFDALEDNDFSDYVLPQEDDYFCSVGYYEGETEGLFAKIKEASDTHVNYAYDRKRNTSLVSMMKRYYISHYSQKALHCEACGDFAFLKPNDEGYLEFHHLIPFKISNGPDHYLNLYGLCANCHRKMHFANDGIKAKMYASIDVNNYLENTVFERLKKLREEGILTSYQLDYLFNNRAISEDEYEGIASWTTQTK